MIAKKNRLKIRKLAEYIALQFDEKITYIEIHSNNRKVLMYS